VPPPEVPEATPEADASITRLLRAVAAGEPAASHQLAPLVHEHLRSIAAAQMAMERRDHTFQPTALAHEAYMKVLGGATVDWQDRAHFFNAAARAMRFVLIDHARAALAGRGADRGNGSPAARGGARRPVALPDNIVDRGFHEAPAEVVALEEALIRFEALDPRAAQIAVWRFYNGMTIEEIARAMSCAVQTVNRDWKRARAWLADAIAASLSAEGPGG